MNRLRHEYYNIRKKIRMWWRLRELKMAIKEADYLSKTHNGRKYVVIDHWAGGFAITWREDFEEGRKRRRGKFARNQKWEDVLNSCHYATKTKGKNGK